MRSRARCATTTSRFSTGSTERQGTAAWRLGRPAGSLPPTSRSAGDGRSVKLVEHDGRRIAAIEYDAALDDEPELLDAVTAAAGLALQNDRLQAELRAEVAFWDTVTNTVPSLLATVDTDGVIRNLNAAAVDVAGHEDKRDVVGRDYWDVFIDASERDEVRGALRSARAGLPGRRVREHLRERPGRAPGRLLADGTRPRRERRRGRDRLGRRRHHHAAQARARAGARARRPDDGVRLDAEHHGRAGARRDDSRPGRRRPERRGEPRVQEGRRLARRPARRPPVPRHPRRGRRRPCSPRDRDRGGWRHLGLRRVGSSCRPTEAPASSCGPPSRSPTSRGGWTDLVLVCGADITERYRLEAEQERERAFLYTIANNAPSLLCLIDDGAS